MSEKIEYRVEKDSIGSKDVPEDVYYGVQSLDVYKRQLCHQQGQGLHRENDSARCGRLPERPVREGGPAPLYLSGEAEEAYRQQYGGLHEERHPPVSYTHLVSGVINSVAFFVISTCTLAPSFRSIRARFTILYAAILPVTPSTAVFPFNVFLSNVICYSSRFIPLDYRGISHFFQYKGPRTFYLLELRIFLCYHYPVIVLYPRMRNNNKEEN